MPSPRRKVTARTVAESAVRHASLATPMNVSGNNVLKRAFGLASRIKHKNITVTRHNIKNAANVIANRLKKQGKTAEANRLLAGVSQYHENMIRVSTSPELRNYLRRFAVAFRAIGNRQ